MSATDRFVKWYYGVHPVVRSIFSAMVATALLYLGAVVERTVQDSTSRLGLPNDVMLLSGMMGLFSLVFFFRLIFQNALKNTVEQESTERDTILSAYSAIDRRITNTMEKLANVPLQETVSESNKKQLITETLFSVESIKEIVRDVYVLFETKYAQAHKVSERIDFEVTFMTRSYKDGHITIPAYANRHSRAPKSLNERDKNPEFYESTVTAECYRVGLPNIRIIEDTARDKSYQEVYPGQRERIRSQIVCPVLSAQNKILGTLVVHCNATGFFSEERRAYWKELLELFAKRLAYEKTGLDLIYNRSHGLEPPF